MENDNLPDIEKTTTPSRRKIASNFGIATALILIIIFLIIYIFNIDESKYSTELTLFYLSVIVVLIIMTMLQVKSRVYEGRISLGQAFGSGVFMLFVATLIFAVFTFIFYQFIAPDKLTEMLQNAQTTLENKGFTGDKLDTAMSFNQKIFSPLGVTLGVFLTYMFFGSILSLIISAFVQRTK